MVSNERRTYSINECAEILGISPALVRRLLREQQISFLQLGRRKVIPKEVLEQLLKEVPK